MRGYNTFFTTVALLAVAALSVLSFFSLDSIKRFEEPLIAQQQFLLYNGWLSKATPVAFIVLLVMALFVYRKTGFARFILLSNIIFIMFTLLDYLLFKENYFHFRQENNLWQGEFSVAGLFGIGFCLLAIALSLAGYLLVRWLNAREL